MGSVYSNNQETMDDISESDESSASEHSEPDLVTVLQYLIRNNARVATMAGNVDVEMLGATGLGNNEDKYPDESDDESLDMPIQSLNKLEESEFKQDTMLKSGRVKKSGFERPEIVMKMLSQREAGMQSSQQFTSGDRCLIASGFLPNTGHVIQQYPSKVFCGTYSQDGRLFLTACQDRCLRLYNCENQQFKLFNTIEARDVGWSVLDTAFSIYGKSDIHHALPLSPEDRRFCIFSLTFSQDGREVLGGANDGCLYVYDIVGARRTLKIQSHDDDVNTVAFADDTSQILFSGGDDGICRVWDRRTLDEYNPKPVGVLAGHRDGITFVDSRGDGRHLITNCKDQSIKLWDMRVFSPPGSLEHMKRVLSSNGWDYRWQGVPKKFTLENRTSRYLKGDTSLMTYTGHRVLQTLIRCRFSPAFTTGQRYIYTGCSTGKLIIYDALTGKKVRELINHHACVRDVSWHPFNSEIVSTSWDRTIVHWTYQEDLTEDPDIDPVIEGFKQKHPNSCLRRRKIYNLRPRNTSR